MKIKLNGKPKEFPGDLSVEDLLQAIGVHPLRVAVLVNEEGIKRERFGEVIVKEGDTVEVLTFMAGGI